MGESKAWLESLMTALGDSSWWMVVLTVLIFINAVLQQRATSKTDERFERLQNKFNWLVGAMETHTNLMMMLQAKQMGIEMIWWDPTEEEPPTEQKHKAPVTLKTIRCNISSKLRKGLSRSLLNFGGGGLRDDEFYATWDSSVS